MSIYLLTLEDKLQIVEFENYTFHFTIEPRSEYFEAKTQNGSIKVWNGESVFGPSETWPAQLQDFGYHIAEETKKGNIDVNDETFTPDNLVGLLQKYKSSIFERSYVKETEVKDTFQKLMGYVEGGILLGILENEVRNAFELLPKYMQLYFKINKSAGKKYIDKLCLSSGIDKNMKLLDNFLLDYAPLHFEKYEVLEKK